MPADAPPCDVLVVGGGPAGGTAARLLSRWGRQVVVVAKPTDQATPDLPVSLTPSCGKFFDLMGIRPEIDALGFVRSTGHTVWWGSPQARVEPFAGGALGWQAGATRLGDALLDRAAASGAAITRRALTAEEIESWPATYRLDCTGRSGVLARALGQRRYEPGLRTVALIGVWEADAAGWDLDDSSHTLLESYADGWAWSIPLDVRRRAVAVMVDPKVTALAKHDGPRTTYLAEVAKTRHLASLVAGATLVAGPSGWDASMYAADRFAGDRWLLVGDAGSFVDPLSSAGVKKAMASGWLAAVVVNTALQDPSLASAAFALFQAREATTYRAFLAMTRQYMAEAGGASTSAHPFWADRADEAGEPDDLPQAVVEAAFERLKAADPLRLRRGPTVTVERRPALGERLVTLEPYLISDSHPEGLRFVLDVDVVALLDLAPSAPDVPTLYERYADKIGRVSWPSFLTALATAIARKWLILE